MSTEAESLRDAMMRAGCQCVKSCDKGPTNAGTCVYFLAKTRGPVSFSPCECVGGGKTYHDGNGNCFKCGASDAFSAHAETLFEARNRPV